MRLKQDMDINVEGIETINYLLQCMKDMQLNIVQLTDRLSFYKTVWKIIVNFLAFRFTTCELYNSFILLYNTSEYLNTQLHVVRIFV